MEEPNKKALEDIENDKCPEKFSGPIEASLWCLRHGVKCTNEFLIEHGVKPPFRTIY